MYMSKRVLTLPINYIDGIKYQLIRSETNRIIDI